MGAWGTGHGVKTELKFRWPPRAPCRCPIWLKPKQLTLFRSPAIMLGSRDWLSADVAQLAEHLICNQAVASSSLAVSSASGSGFGESVKGGVPQQPTGADY